MSIMAKLKKATREYHARIEALPYTQQLAAHTLPLQCYINQLRAMAIIHSVLESEITMAQDICLAAIWNDDLKKYPLLQQDLNFFAPHNTAEASTTREIALAIAYKIRLRRVENPITLLGYLYVLEGSTLGNSMHRVDIKQTFQLTNFQGYRYYCSYQDQVQQHWLQFSQHVDRTMDDISQHESIIVAARELFADLENLYSLLYPPASEHQNKHITHLNPEAGNHPMPTDKREIEAALKASKRILMEYPYFEQRYGERGKRFSDSDICWLVTLTTLDTQTIKQQSAWLGRLLATRGMPQIILEYTLQCLQEELVNAIAENAQQYAKLQVAVQMFQKSRTNIISEREFRALASEFDRRIPVELAHTYKNSGKLLVAAVVDEMNGIEGAVAALQGWMTDATRFDGDWIAMVHTVVDKAMRIASHE